MGSHIRIKKRGDFRLRGKGRRWQIKRKSKDKPMVFKQYKVKPLDASKIASPWEILQLVLMSEKAVRAVEGENMLVFIARREADKRLIKAAFEKAFNSKVRSVRTVLDQDNRKKAYITLAQPGAASEIAIKLGII